MTLRDLEADLAQLTQGFEQDKRLALVVRNEYANPVYSTGFIAALFEEEGSDLFDVRREILGHFQQGGNPSPFDRIQATRLAAKCIEFLISAAGESPAAAAFIGLEAGEVQFHSLANLPSMVDEAYQRPHQQWWLRLRTVANTLGQPAPRSPRASTADE